MTTEDIPIEEFRTFEIRGLGEVNLALPNAEDRARGAEKLDAGDGSEEASMDVSIFTACLLLCDDAGIRRYSSEEAQSSAKGILEGCAVDTIVDLIRAVEAVLADSYLKDNPPQGPWN